MLCCAELSLSAPSDSFPPLWTVAPQAPLSMGILQGRILEWVASSPPEHNHWGGGETEIFCLLSPPVLSGVDSEYRTGVGRKEGRLCSTPDIRLATSGMLSVLVIIPQCSQRPEELSPS